MGHSFEAPIQITRTDADKRQVFGWLYVSRNKDGEEVWDLKMAACDPPVLEDAAYNFVLDHRLMGVMHQKDFKKDPIQVGRLIESICFTREKWDAMGIKDFPYECAWWVGFIVDNDDVWEGIKSGHYPELSLSGTAEAQYLE